eukprot:GHVN01035442.1.p1 GENE.GHVN01035442.1~~GHVN01035442.1.p1  ORF type:complete len:579 (+),score=121.09 GHVN01035442.1:634-2370(+)
MSSESDMKRRAEREAQQSRGKRPNTGGSSRQSPPNTTSSSSRQPLSKPSSSSSSSSMLPPSSKPIKVRIISSAGQNLITVREGASLGELMTAISQALKINKVELYHDEKHTMEISGCSPTSIRSLGINNGHSIYAKAPGAVIEGRAINGPGARMTSADLPPSPPTQPQTDSSRQASTSAPAHSSSLSPSLSSSSAAQTSIHGTPSASSSSARPQSAGGEGFEFNNETKSNFKSFDAYMCQTDFNISDLPNMKNYGGNFVDRRNINKVPPTMTLKHQAYRHVDHLEFMNLPEVQEFVRYWRDDLDMAVSRAGILYGYYLEDKHYEMGVRAVVEGIYEPPQTSKDGEAVLLEDPFADEVDKVAHALGLEKLGWVFTHLPRDEALTSSEVVQVAKMQNASTDILHYTGYPTSRFVTCTISPSGDTGGDPTPNAYMVSDMGQAFERHRLLSPAPPDPLHLQLREAEKNEVLPLVLESGNPVKKFDSHWFIVRVNESAPKQVRSIFTNTKFPRENRARAIVEKDLGDYFRQVSDTAPSSKRVSDFHLLLYVARVFGTETACVWAKAVLVGGEVDRDFITLLTG